MDLTSRINNYIDRNYRWFNITVVAFMQMFVLLIALAMSYRDSGITFFIACINTTALYFRYRHPYGAIWFVLVSTALTLFIPDVLPVHLYFPVGVAAYHIGRHWKKKLRVRMFIAGWIGAFAVGVQLFVMLLPRGEQFAAVISSIIITTLCGAIYSVLWFIGDSRRTRIIRQDELRERAMRLEFEQEQERRLAAQDERTRIAREMHDIVAHSLSSIITQADGARYAAAAIRTTTAQPAETTNLQEHDASIAEQTLETIAITARDSLTQMRSLLGVLRTDEDTMYAPAPTIHEIPALVAQARRSGVNIDFAGITGTISGALPQGADLAAYRVIQEALTNIVKHARDAEIVTLSAAWKRDGLYLDVYNSAPAHHNSSDAPYSFVPGSGNGLLGMRERITMYGGTLHYGPDLQGGFSVKAWLPYRET